MKTKFWLAAVLSLTLLVSGCAPIFSSVGLTGWPFSAPAAVSTPTAAQIQPVTDSAAVPASNSLLATLEETFQQIYASVSPSVVNIQVASASGGGEGSGFVWDSEGHIITNNHVVEGARQILVTFSDGSSYEASLVGSDPESDLAVIRVDTPSALLQPVTLADSRVVQVGELAVAIGNPFGLSGTMTQGIVSALSRSLSVDEGSPLSTGSYTIPDIIQTDAAINPGNSGGVLVDSAGSVLGVTTAIQSSTNSSAGIGFVIPAHIVERIVPALIADGAYIHPRMGISGATLTADLVEAAGLEEGQRGVLVVSVNPNSPADQAGLLGSQQSTANGQASFTGSDVIVAVDGQPLTSFEQLTSYLFNITAPDQTIALTVLRQGSEQVIELTLQAAGG